MHWTTREQRRSGHGTKARGLYARSSCNYGFFAAARRGRAPRSASCSSRALFPPSLACAPEFGVRRPGESSLLALPRSRSSRHVFGLGLGLGPSRFSQLVRQAVARSHSARGRLLSFAGIAHLFSEQLSPSCWHCALALFFFIFVAASATTGSLSTAASGATLRRVVVSFRVRLCCPIFFLIFVAASGTTGSLSVAASGATLRRVVLGYRECILPEGAAFFGPITGHGSLVRLRWQS